MFFEVQCFKTNCINWIIGLKFTYPLNRDFLPKNNNEITVSENFKFKLIAFFIHTIKYVPTSYKVCCCNRKNFQIFSDVLATWMMLDKRSH